MNFNEYIETKAPLMKSLGSLFDVNCGDNKLSLKDIKVHQPDYDYADCLVRQKPYCYKVELFAEYVDGPDKGKKFKYIIEIPKMCEHGFLISDPSGNKLKFRAPIIVGEINQRLQYRGNKSDNNRRIKFRSLLNITLDEYTSPAGKQYPSIVVLGEKGELKPKAVYPIAGYLLHYGIDESKLSKYFNTKMIPELTEGEYAPITIPDEQIGYYNDKILQITKIDPKLSKSNNVLSAEIIFELIKIAIDSPLTYEPFSPFDITFMDFSKLLFDIDLRSHKWIKRKIADGVMKNHDVGAILTKHIYKSFSMQVDSGSIQTAANSNALSFLSQSNKIYFKNYKEKNKKQMIYTTDFYGVVCPSKTPESVTLTSVKNELAIDASFDKDQRVMISVYPKSYLTEDNVKPINIPYSDYYRARVISLDNIDYRIKKVIPENGKIKIFHLGEFKEIPYKSTDDFDYIRSSPEGALAINTGIIPMANKCDGTRMSMATNMLDQAIPVLGARPSIVKTAVNRLVFDKSNFNVKSTVNGEVVRVVDNYITVQLDDKSFRTFAVPDSINSSSHTSNRLMPAVVVGDKVKKGDILYISDSFKGKELALTVPLRVGYYAYGFKTEEDAIVISESASKLLAHKITKIIRIDIPSTKVALFDKQAIINKLTDIGRIDAYRSKLNKLNDFGLPIPGEEYSRLNRECIAFYQAYTYDPEKPSGKIMDLIHKNAKKENLRMYHPVREDLPSEFSDGTINRVRVFYKNTPKVKERYAKLIEYYDQVHKDYIDEVTGGLKTKLPELSITIGPKDPIDISILVTITSTKPAGISDKITNRYASKGTIGDVIPDDQMPRIGDEDGIPLQIMIPPQSTINRKNISQIYEMNLCLVCKMAFDRNEKNIKDRNYDDARKVLNNLYVTNRFDNYSNADIEAFHKTFEEYYSIEVNSIDKVYTQKVMSDLCQFFGIDQDGSYLYDPIESERITIQKITVGITEIMRLDKIPEMKSKATADVMGSDSTVLYGGATRSGGQSIGEMERWQVLVHGIQDPINESVKKSRGISLDEYTDIMILNQARAAGLEFELYKQLLK